MVAIPATIAPRIGSLLRMLASPADGEALNAARALGRTLGGAGLDLNDLADVIEHPLAPVPLYRQSAPARRPRPTRAGDMGSVELSPKRCRQVVDGLTRAAARGVLSAWEREFCASVVVTLRGPKPRLSARQHEVIERLMLKLGENSAWA